MYWPGLSVSRNDTPLQLTQFGLPFCIKFHNELFKNVLNSFNKKKTFEFGQN